MKMKATVFAVLMLALSLFVACAKQEQSDTYTVTLGNTIYTVDTQNNTISDGSNTYGFSVSGSVTGYDVEITYPNGSTYWWHEDNSGTGLSGYGGSSGDYDTSLYPDGDTLKSVLKEQSPRQTSDKNGFLIFLLLAVGIFNTVSPRTAWYLSYGWRYKDAQPSDAALVIGRISGIAALVIGVVMLIV